MTTALGIRSLSVEKPIFPGLSLVGETGFEPATARPPAGCATRLRHSPWCYVPERATGIEPALEAWKASVQPQHFARRLRQMIPGAVRWWGAATLADGDVGRRTDFRCKVQRAAGWRM